jgi:hypothetical protein
MSLENNHSPDGGVIHSPHIKGGSKPGKPQSVWPAFFIVAADAVAVRWQGSQEAMLTSRKKISSALLHDLLEMHFPGFWWEASQRVQGRKTPLWALLRNRVYKGYYSGTSDRGTRHDPNTRASISREHWTHRVGSRTPLANLHNSLVTNSLAVVGDWRKYL